MISVNTEPVSRYWLAFYSILAVLYQPLPNINGGVINGKSDKYEIAEGNIYFPPEAVKWEYLFDF